MHTFTGLLRRVRRFNQLISSQASIPQPPFCIGFRGFRQASLVFA